MLRRALAIGAASASLLVSAACNGGGAPIGPASVGIGMSTMHGVSAAIQPSVVPIRPVVPFGCPVMQPFTTAFDIVLQHTDVPLLLDHVTFHFLDGANISSAPMTFGRESATGPGIFSFRPQFGCGIGQPQLVIADIVLVDGKSPPFTINTTATMR
jgi:hypothetical protein